MVNDRVSECPILIPYKLEPSRSTLTPIRIGCPKHEVPARSRGAFFVDNLDGVRRFTSVA